MIRSGNVEVPIQALNDKVPFHLNKLSVGVLVSNKFLNVLNGWLMHVLFIDFTGQKYT
jgi:hypothetical protein